MVVGLSKQGKGKQAQDRAKVADGWAWALGSTTVQKKATAQQYFTTPYNEL